MTVERVKEVAPRRGRAGRRATSARPSRASTSATTRSWSTRTASQAIAARIREFAPDVLLTHTDRDPFNPDHAEAFFAVEKARALAAGAGTASAFGGPFEPPELLLFEPHQPELCNFTPTVFLDITAVIEQKRAAMAEMEAQSHLAAYYDAAGRAARQPRAPLVRQRRDRVRGGVPARDAAGGGRAVSESTRSSPRSGRPPSTRRPAARRSSTSTSCR